MKHLRKVFTFLIVIVCTICFAGCFGEKDKSNTAKTQTYKAYFYISNAYLERCYDEYFEFAKQDNIKEQSDIVLPGNPQKRDEVGSAKLVRSEGFTFLGWSLDKSTIYDPSVQIEIADDIKFYALYKQDNYTIAYELNGGTNSEENPTTYAYSFKEPNAIVTLNDPVKNGYDFDGWHYYDYEEEYTTITQIRTSYRENLTLYAEWTPTVYDIVYSSGDYLHNEVKQLKYKYTIEDEFDLINLTLDVTHHPGVNAVFDGWYKNADLSGEKITKIKKGTTGMICLYPKWILVK